MAYGGGRRSTASSIMEVLTLNPVPYPVLVLLGVILLLLGIQWFADYESIMESTEETMGWALLATPLLLILAVKWLSGIENPERMLFGFDDGRRRRNYYNMMMPAAEEGGSSPWGVAALILLLLVLVQFHDTFRESWFI